MMELHPGHLTITLELNPHPVFIWDTWIARAQFDGKRIEGSGAKPVDALEAFISGLEDYLDDDAEQEGRR